ncbi:hypothetical protein CEUSTIGMA_g703.t1 [Chlamydomonas eustigma]|uniref:DM2 domain-containing protein n=1 Tax=Chlamydomonas eustigma TaxID=1157962 RepID=A0A250WRC9_9CHLO|nr:hypothetical protein CEUSTIGMA_g703.t1 [Chlamydomonas eustigma]|eukprot:GAX73249.1 hypothetical protein CEUSTIGMA_g703.t1 [Chlamydomonas eustigma]
MNPIPPNVSTLLSQLTPPQHQQLMQQLAAAQASVMKPGGLPNQQNLLVQQMAAMLQLQQQQQVAKAAAAVLANSSQALASPRAPLPVLPISNSVESAAAAAAKRNKKRKATDQAVHDKPSISIPESTAFTSLEVLERKVDYLLLQKRSEIKEAVLLPEHTKQKLRLYISHSHAHQRPQTDRTHSGHHNSNATPQSSEPPSWTLLITGRVLNSEPSTDASSSTQPAIAQKVGEAAPGTSSSAAPQPPTSATPSYLPSASLPGSSQSGVIASNQMLGETAGPGSSTHQDNVHPACFYFRRVEVKLDPELYPGEEGTFIWDKASHVGSFKDQLELKRIGSKSFDATVTIHLDWQPERFILDPRLAQVLNTQCDTEARVIKAFWVHVKEHRLQDPLKPNQIKLPLDLAQVRIQDPLKPNQIKLPLDLAQVLGTSNFKASDISEQLAPFLKPIEPIVIKHEIKLDGPSVFTPYCYDIDVELPTYMPGDKISESIDKISVDKEVEAIDQQLTQVIQRINEHQRRRDMYLAFAHSPSDFVGAMAASQARDMRTGKSANGNDFEVERRSDLFKQQWVQEAVLKYLQKRLGRSSY